MYVAFLRFDMRQKANGMTWKGWWTELKFALSQKKSITHKKMSNLSGNVNCQYQQLLKITVRYNIKRAVTKQHSFIGSNRTNYFDDVIWREKAIGIILTLESVFEKWSGLFVWIALSLGDGWGNWLMRKIINDFLDIFRWLGKSGGIYFGQAAHMLIWTNSQFNRSVNKIK